MKWRGVPDPIQWHDVVDPATDTVCGEITWTGRAWVLREYAHGHGKLDRLTAYLTFRRATHAARRRGYQVQTSLINI